MAAGIAHEIRNPLASMSGSIQILRQELPLQRDQAQLMDIVLRESERLNDTIRSSWPTRGRSASRVARLDSGGVVTRYGAAAAEQPRVAASGTAIEVNVPGRDVLVEADEGQVRQIVWNLATNGLRAMPDGGTPDAQRAVERRARGGAAL